MWWPAAIANPQPPLPDLSHLKIMKPTLRLLTLLALMLLHGVGYAADEALFATVHRLRGEVKALNAGGTERHLRLGDQVFVGEKVSATASSEAVLRTLDAGMVAVRPAAEFEVQGFKARGDRNDSMALRLLTGSLRVISGWISRSNPSAHKIITPTATIGIRGTDHEPYVLTKDMPSANADAPYRAGTYDKVNRGGTTLSANDQDLNIDPGKVGFIRAEPKQRTRALLTLLLPVLLDKIPEFYVPGEFDAELDQFSETATAQADKALEQQLKAPVATPAVVAAPSAVPSASSSPVAPAAIAALPAPLWSKGDKCVPMNTGKAWIDALDNAIVRKDGQTILDLFAPDVAVKAVVRKKDGSLTSVDFSRDELVRSTLSTVNQLEGYQHRRLSLKAAAVGAKKSGTCRPLQVESVVIEQGLLSGKPYRFESTESYLLEVRDGKWLAVRAETTQR
jgi:hypothetical protein